MKNMTRGQAHQGDFSVGRGQIGNNKSCYGREQCCGVVVCWEVVWSGGIGLIVRPPQAVSSFVGLWLGQFSIALMLDYNLLLTGNTCKKKTKLALTGIITRVLLFAHVFEYILF